MMTICIGVICEKGNKAIAAADRMITARTPPVQYEARESKIIRISDSFVVLTAGDAIAHTELLYHAVPLIQKERTPQAYKIAEILAECYDVQRKKKITEKILRPRGLTLSKFYENFNRFPPEFSLTIDREIERFDYGLYMLMVGVDETGGHLYDIRNPGVISCLDEIGHHEIGSGVVQARMTFISQRYSIATPVNEALYLTYEAKKNAEMAPGVGRETDIVIIKKESLIEIDENIFNQLENIYKQRKEGKTLETLKEDLEQLNTLLKEVEKC